jgi:predicted phosphate transport protein (TIGR00153 family)
MLKRLLPRQENFFHFFQQAVDKIVLTATEFTALLQHLDQQQLYVDRIAKHEEEADRIAHSSFELLHKTFITPFDRNDIHELTSILDDILDLINRIAQRFPFYQLTSVPEEVVHLSQFSVEAANHLKEAVYQLHSLKHTNTIFQHCHAIDQVERQAHRIVLAGEKKLFSEVEDFKLFFKLKEIYGHTKLVINRCQDVANLIKGIVLEYS